MFEMSFKCFESLSSGSNLDSNSLNPFPMVLIWIRLLRIPFECFESLSNGSNLNSNGSNLNSNASNPFRMLRI